MARSWRGDDDTIHGEYAIVPVGSTEGGKNSSARDRRRAEAARKLEVLIECRLSGNSWEVCRKRAGYANSGTAYRRFHQWLERQPSENVQQLRRTITTRLDRALQAIWRQVEAGHLPAVDRLLAIEHQRARVLGLEQAPPDDSSPDDAQVLALARRYSGLTSEEVEAEVRRLDWVVHDAEEEPA